MQNEFINLILQFDKFLPSLLILRVCIYRWIPLWNHQRINWIFESLWFIFIHLMNFILLFFWELMNVIFKNNRLHIFYIFFLRFFEFSPIIFQLRAILLVSILIDRPNIIYFSSFLPKVEIIHYGVNLFEIFPFLIYF